MWPKRPVPGGKDGARRGTLSDRPLTSTPSTRTGDPTMTTNTITRPLSSTAVGGSSSGMILGSSRCVCSSLSVLRPWTGVGRDHHQHDEHNNTVNPPAARSRHQPRRNSGAGGRSSCRGRVGGAMPRTLTGPPLVTQAGRSLDLKLEGGVGTQPLVLVADDEPRITKLVSIALRKRVPGRHGDWRRGCLARRRKSGRT